MVPYGTTPPTITKQDFPFEGLDWSYLKYSKVESSAGLSENVLTNDDVKMMGKKDDHFQTTKTQYTSDSKPGEYVKSTIIMQTNAAIQYTLTFSGSEKGPPFPCQTNKVTLTSTEIGSSTFHASLRVSTIGNRGGTTFMCYLPAPPTIYDTDTDTTRLYVDQKFPSAQTHHVWPYPASISLKKPRLDGTKSLFSLTDNLGK